jgi:hypothetical protein
MPYNYDDAYLRERASSGGKDPGRMRTAEQLAAAARGGDQAALSRLLDFTGGPGDPTPGNEWATADARNFGKMLLRDIIPDYQPVYDKAHDGSFSLGKTLGGVLKVAAPIAGALIPGVGMLGAAAIGGLGNLGGQALQGGKINFGQSLLSGALGAGGNALLGNGLGAGSSGWLGSAGQGAQALGGAGQLGAQGVMAPGGGTLGAVGTPGIASGGGVFGKLGGFLGGADGKIGLNDILSGVGMIGGGISAAGAQDRANDQREAAISGATQEWQQRAPMRDLAQQQLLGLNSIQRPDFSQIFADPGNPFMQGRQAPLPFATVGSH